MRTEKDTLGKVKVPERAYYGAQTMRAIKNFPISGLRLPRSFIKAQGTVKLAAARVNGELGLLDIRMMRAIEKAAQEVIAGVHDREFVVDVYQAGAGTSQNMNANEVIANRANELLGGKRGDYRLVHPNDHVNMSQSTNDTIPTSICISAYEALTGKLLPAMKKLKRELSFKARKFHNVVKAGRTHLQDAVPMRLGQEFSGYAASVENDILRLETASKSLLRIPIGGSAVGTGINVHSGFRARAIREIRKITKISFNGSGNLFEGIQNIYPALELSAAMRGAAITLIKIANDIRILSSGPRTGLAEIILPAVQPGSSIMPGKVNPVMAEMLNMVCFQVIGNDTAIAYAAQASQLELNVMMPMVAYNLHTSIEILANSIDAFSDKCIAGLDANRTRCREYGEATIALATALNPIIGYASAAELAREAYLSGKPVKQIVVDRGILSKKHADRILDPRIISGE